MRVHREAFQRVLADLLSPLASKYFGLCRASELCKRLERPSAKSKMARLLRNAALIHFVRLGGKVSDRSHADGTNFTISSLQCL
jgi:hypothetical protein